MVAGRGDCVGDITGWLGVDTRQPIGCVEMIVGVETKRGTVTARPDGSRESEGIGGGERRSSEVLAGLVELNSLGRAAGVGDIRYVRNQEGNTERLAR